MSLFHKQFQTLVWETEEKDFVENHFRKSPFNYKIIESRLSLLHPDLLLQLLEDHSPERAVLVFSCLRWNTVFLA